MRALLAETGDATAIHDYETLSVETVLMFGIAMVAGPGAGSFETATGANKSIIGPRREPSCSLLSKQKPPSAAPSSTECLAAHA